ncbi:MAG TPA: DUF6338 family protein [Syntrophales bacterium]|nr:DUF6338 family protein [Syntrophales bacterium]
MDIWKIDKLILFLIFFIPGFLSLKIYDWLVASEKRDFSKSLFEVIGYSAINFASLFWLIILIHRANFYERHFILYFFALLLILFIIPICWPFIFITLSKTKLLAKYLIHPWPKPWDFVFASKESFWIIVHLKDGKKIGGKYDTKSFTSSYPVEEQLYIEEIWDLDEDGRFKQPVERSRGMIFFKDDILAVEFFS